MKRTLVFAHRGAKREAAENTRPAFDKALAYPIDGIETDIQLSRDEVAVLWHDDDLAKLELPGKRIDDFDYAQLQKMDFAAHFGAADRDGVMSLEDFVAAYRARCRLLLEIKRYPGEAEARQQIKIRQTLELADDAILVSSFDLDSLIYAHRIAQQFPLVFNLEPEHQADFAQRALVERPFLHGLCVHISTLDEAMIGVVRERGKLIAVYTCNSDEQISRALTLGVDVLISDVPQKALEMRDR
ncbi:MAG: glycerophosphodiester phosphodiesterase [Sideroxyarcus sp.]|nr:glycerophosphodiester phosphodiesterase [Sideroxyarcus sp.]